MKLAVALAVVVTLVAGCGPSPARPRTPEPDQDAVTTEAPARAALAAAAANVVDDGLALPEVRYAVGDRYTVVDDFRIKSRVELSEGESIRYDRNQDTETTFEVLELDAQGKVSRQRVTFAIDDVRSILDRTAQRETSVIVGKTYVVTEVTGAITVTDDRGRTPPKAEVAAVRARATESSVDAALDRMYAGRRWNFGERVQLGAEALEVVNRAQRDPRTRYTAYAMELRAVENGVATFAVSWSFDQGTNNGPLTFQLSGTREVDVATGRVIRLTLRGPMQGHLGAPVAGEATTTSHTR